MHVTTGAGGAPALDTFGDGGPWTRLQDRQWGYGRLITRNASVLTFQQVINADDSVFDEFSIEK